MADCPSCNSKNTKTLRMIWLSGTRNSTGKSGRVGMSSRGTVWVSRGAGASRSQSAAAQAASPPDLKKPMSPWIGVLLVFFLTHLVLSAMINTILPSLWFAVLIGDGVACYFAYNFFKVGFDAANLQNLRAIEQYEKSWMCMRCGNVYTADDF